MITMTTPSESTAARLERFREETERFRAGKCSPDHYRAFRIPFGVYEQRVSGRYMLRLRITAGDLTGAQLRALARVAERDGSAKLHVTTRQAVQVHDLPVGRLHSAMVTLSEAGLSSLGGGGNSVRNITACSRTGFCDRECFGVAGHARALTTRLLQTPFALDLPRKFKLAFSGCDEDCAAARANDLGFVACVQEGRSGFAVFVGGGMGGHSCVGHVLDQFVPEERIFHVAEAVKRVFDRHGNRRNRHQARLRFLVAQLGFESFKARYLEAIDELKGEPPLTLDPPTATPPAARPAPLVVAGAAGTCDFLSAPPHRLEAWLRSQVNAQHRPGLSCIEIPLFLGTLSSAEATAVANVADLCGIGAIRSTQEQNLTIPWVPEATLQRAFELLDAAGLAAPMPPVLSRMIVCAGASTCRLGICHSRGLADELRNRLLLSSIDLHALGPVRIHVSGCPNSCGRHLLADIGLSGAARRIGQSLAPHYEVRLGSRSTTDTLSFAEGRTVVPAKAVPHLLVDLLSAFEREAVSGDFTRFARESGARLLSSRLEQFRDGLRSTACGDPHVDCGTSELFSLAGRSPGECSAGVFDLIEIDLAAAEEALDSGALYAATVSTCRALLVSRGIGVTTDREALEAFARAFVSPGFVAAEHGPLVQGALAASGTENPAVDFLGSAGSVAELLEAVRALYVGLGQSLRLPEPQQPDEPRQYDKARSSNEAHQADRTRQAVDRRASEVHEPDPRCGPSGEPAGLDASIELPAAEIDLRGVVCPLNYVKTRMALGKIARGKLLLVLLDEAGARNVPESVARDGHEVCDVLPAEDHWRVVIRRC